MPTPAALAFIGGAATRAAPSALGMAAGRAAGFVGGIAAGTAVWSTISPWSREAQYYSNNIGPTSVIDPATAIHLLHCDRLTPLQLQQIMRWHGAQYLPPDVSDKLVDHAWYHAVDIAKPLWDIEAYRYWYRQERISEAQLRARLTRSGHNDTDEQDLFINDRLQFDASLILQLYTRGEITENDARSRLTQLGYLRGLERDLLIGLQQGPAPGEVLMLRNREEIDDAAANKYLKWYGFREDEVRQRMLGLRNLIPSPQELISFAIKEGWDDDVANTFGYDQEFPGPFQLWMERQGLGWNPGPVTVDGVTYPAISWPRLWWRQHWRNIAPTQAYEWLHRFRLTGGPGGGPRVPAAGVFTVDQLDKILKIDDYAPAFRNYLREASYRVLTRVDIRRLLQTGVIDQAEAAEQYQDQGYRPADATRLAAFAVELKNTQQLKALNTGQRARVVAAYKAGVLDRDTAAVQLALLALPSYSEYIAASSLPLADQIAAALSSPFVVAQLDSIDADVRMKMANKAVAAVGKMFKRREIDEPTARQHLATIGIRAPRIDDWILQWQWEMMATGKHASAAQMIGWLKRGVVSWQETFSYLLLLGYDQMTAFTMTAVAQQDHDLAVAKAQVQAAKDVASQQAALIKQQQVLRRMTRETQAAMARHATASQLLKWYKADLIEEKELRYRLRIMGHTDIDIGRMIDTVSPGEGTDIDSQETAAAFAADIDTAEPAEHTLPTGQLGDIGS